MAFSTTNSTILTATIVTAGRWQEGKPLSVGVVVGAGFLAFSLAAISEANIKLAQNFGLLILAAAIYRFGPALFAAIGATKVEERKPVKPEKKRSK